MNINNIPQSVTDLFTVLDERGIQYTLVGGVAMLQYVAGRNTQDLDFIVSKKALKQIPGLDIKDSNTYFAYGTFADLQVDFLLTDNPLFTKVQRQYAARQPFLERTISCATVEGLMLLKLYALPNLYRQRDFERVGLYENDISTLLYKYKTPVKPLVDQLSEYMTPGELEGIRTILVRIEQTIQQRDHFFDAPDQPSPDSADLDL